MASGAFDLILLYNFLKKLVTPFNKWDAYKSGVIDADGKILAQAKDRTPEQKKSWGYYDRLVANLKKLIAKVPGGKSRIATFAAALLLLKEEIENPDDVVSLEETFNKYLEEAELLNEEGPANVVGGGAIAGVGVGPKGEPGVKKKKKRKVVLAMIKRMKEK